jgi:hypothetical protein
MFFQMLWMLYRHSMVGFVHSCSVAAALQMRDLEARLLEEREEKAVLAGEPGADQQQP